MALRTLALSAFLVLLATGASAQDGRRPATDALRAAATITEEDVRRRVGVIAHDSMRGRATPSPGLDATAAWMAAEFRRLGLRPAGDAGGFVQRYAIETVALAPPASGDGLLLGRDLLPAVTSALPADGALEGELVFVVGTRDPGAGLRASDVQGRVIVVAGPRGGDAGRDRATLGVAQVALERGARAVLVASDAPDARWRQARQQAEDGRWTRVGGADGIPLYEVRDAALERQLPAGATSPTELRSFRDEAVQTRILTGRRLRLEVPLRAVSSAAAPNVAAILPGSDPALRDEYVVFSAHMDHVGVGRPDATGDSIYNGADDDASGTATVVELAEAFAALDVAPRRSLVFLGVSGEEQGLWGSAYFAENPPVPAEAMVANLNIDMIGRNWRDTIVAIGREHSDLGATLDRVAAAHPELGLTPIDDPWPEQSFYTRSDHFNFARRGVPVLFFFSGTHEHYHQPGDEPELIDAEKTARIGRLLFWLGLEVGDAADRPRWDPESRRRIVGGGR